MYPVVHSEKSSPGCEFSRGDTIQLKNSQCSERGLGDLQLCPEGVFGRPLKKHSMLADGSCGSVS